MVLAVCIGLAAAAWKSYGAAATRIIAGLTTQFVIGSQEPDQSPVAVEPASPAVRAEAANAAPAQPASAPQTASVADTSTPAAAVSPGEAQLLQSMTRDLATLQQQVEELKGSVEQLKASQQQMSRDLAKASELKASEVKASEVKPSEQKPRSKTATTTAPTAPTPPRSSAVPGRRQMQSFGPPQVPATASALPPPSPYYAPPQRYVPPQPDPVPQPTTQPPIQDDAWVPRPPMPVR
jgi:hypothetical protein